MQTSYLWAAYTEIYKKIQRWILQSRCCRGQMRVRWCSCWDQSPTASSSSRRMMSTLAPRNIRIPSHVRAYRINFPCFPLETKFSQFVKANTPTKGGKQKGLLNLSWLRRYRQLVIPEYITSGPLLGCRDIRLRKRGPRHEQTALVSLRARRPGKVQGSPVLCPLTSRIGPNVRSMDQD